uniref:UvrABC system protein C n=2 Tax=Candidatus Bipolaricaulota TaxID=67810 RepID=H5SNH3_9BACT|nr:excinuclease ABC subunit C [uncultured Acetothermia bacterium]BAL59393.1 excinuclease ABC subunit C [Candidatus Acetothermum autotrophicum]
MEAKLQNLPAEPGVYLLKDAQGEILYVGKAASLRDRVRSYFQTLTDPKTQRLMQEVSDFEYIVTRTERDALLLEATLIKSHQPRYNIRLKDDKRYPYIKITDEPFPRVEIARRVARDGKYFGPYTNSDAVRETIKILQKIFRLRTCALDIKDPPVRKRPCLDHYIGLCDAPCVGAISQAEYAKLVEEATLFLRGRGKDLIEELQQQMEWAVERLEFEQAARLRDQIKALEQLFAGQRELAPRPTERDVIGYALGNGTACVQVFFVRRGKLVGRESFFVEVPSETSDTELITAFVKQYYGKAEQIPKEILVPCALDEPEAIEGWLSERRQGPVRVKVATRGPARKLLELVAHNAELALRERAALPERGAEWEALQELQKILHLPTLPRRIEAYDISNLYGQHAVGSMVVFCDGMPKKSQYRRFRIETVSQIDDFAMLAEVLRRRLERAQTGDERFLPLPDLILIDGGKGQLSAARAVLRQLGFEKIPTLALAKEHEHIFVAHRAQPIVLPHDDPALQLLQRVRDEAHRFAVTYHRAMRRRRFLESVLDGIAGLGPVRKQRLLQRFGSLQGIQRASVDQLCEVLPEAVARRLYDALRVPSSSATKSLLERTNGARRGDPSP